MKRFIFTWLYILVALAWAQDSPSIMRGGYMKVHQGKESAYEKAVASHVRKWHGLGQWNQSAWRVETGPRTGQYFVGTFGHFWKDFDDRVTTKEHDKDWERILSNFVDNDDEGNGSMFMKYSEKLSYGSGSGSSKLAVTYYYYRTNAIRDMMEIIGKAKTANEKANFEDSYNVYTKEAGGPNEVIIIVDLMDGYADMAPVNPSLAERYTAAHGEDAWKTDFETWTNGLRWSETDIMTYMPNMSTPPAK
jgi:hypothetical protein